MTEPKKDSLKRKETALQHAISKNDLYLTPQEVAPLLDCDPNTLRLMAKERPEDLRIPYTFVGKRMIFPKLPFLKFMGIDVVSLLTNN